MYISRESWLFIGLQYHVLIRVMEATLIPWTAAFQFRIQSNSMFMLVL